ncbi:carbohydrate-binding module family 20 domain-containing protein [Arachidicoccus sp.]|uniref:carbohydrate-binding module family 20 domain-containing protein n=1 Tax=Arachidicoccus sp. TaxID=1872624 RepID=UPI003D1ADC51
MSPEKEKTPKKLATVRTQATTKTVKKAGDIVVKKAIAKKAASNNAVGAETSKPATAKKVEKPVGKTKAIKTVAKNNALSITFQLIYSTAFGQSIFIVGDQPSFGSNSDDKALALAYVDQNHWSLDIELDRKTLGDKGLNYYYIIKNQDGSFEKSAVYHLEVPSALDALNISDAWNYSGFEQNAFSTDVFKVLIPGHIASIKKTALKKGTHQFKIKAPQLAANQIVCLLGNNAALSNWNPEKAVLLFPDTESGFWKVNVTLAQTSAPVQYKYGIYDIENKSFIAFEQGDNRRLLDAAAGTKAAVLNDGFFRNN